jgi:hypothetical protein
MQFEDNTQGPFCQVSNSVRRYFFFCPLKMSSPPLTLAFACLAWLHC